MIRVLVSGRWHCAGLGSFLWLLRAVVRRVRRRPRPTCGARMSRRFTATIRTKRTRCCRPTFARRSATTSCAAVETGRPRARVAGQGARGEPQGQPDVGERALISFSDGSWCSSSARARPGGSRARLVSRSRAQAAPRRGAVVSPRRSPARHAGVLNVLTQRRRDGLTKQVEGFVAGIGKRINDRMISYGQHRAELRWDENGSLPHRAAQGRRRVAESTTSTSGRPRGRGRRRSRQRLPEDF